MPRADGGGSRLTKASGVVILKVHNHKYIMSRPVALILRVWFLDQFIEYLCSRIEIAIFTTHLRHGIRFTEARHEQWCHTWGAHRMVLLTAAHS